jgi:acyl carrier protein
MSLKPYSLDCQHMVDSIDDVSGWLFNWLTENGHVQQGSLPTLLDVNFLTAGWIDSFAMINLLSEIQQRYGIEIDIVHFERPDFATIRGLANLVGEIRGAQS